MKRYEKIMHDAEKEITLKDSEKAIGEKIIRNFTSNVYSTNYANPPIPKGYKYICGEWYNGFVIEKISDGSQFAWVPVGCLKSNGTLDGMQFVEKFGRRNYLQNEFSNKKFYEPLSNELLNQLESIKKYGGFYISCYNITKSSKGKPQSIRGVMPWVEINFNEAKAVSASFENNEAVKSHLTYGAEYDSILEWFIESKKRTVSEIVEDSTNWGNNWWTKNSPRKIVKTGSREEWCTNKIYDFDGNIDEWTQEKCGSFYNVIRGTDYYGVSRFCPVAYRSCSFPNLSYRGTGFRIALVIK